MSDLAPPDPLSPPEPLPVRPVPVVQDPLPGSEPAGLTGPAERHQYGPVLMAVLGGLAALVAFQGVSLLATGVLLGRELFAGGEDIATVLARNADTVFAANAIGQFVGLAMVAILLARLHTPQVLAYLRVNRPDLVFLGLASVGLFLLLPFVSLTGEWAQQIPLPEGLREWDERQKALVEQVLGGGVSVGLALLFVAVTPAICEELLFRGYIQRNVERVMGVAGALVVVGVAFGAFHMQFGNLVPLSVLGVYLAFVVWVSGSLWTGVLVHLFNNGTAILVSQYAQSRPDPLVLDDLHVPWYLGVAGLAAALGVAALMRERRARLLAGAPPPPPFLPPLRP